MEKYIFKLLEQFKIIKKKFFKKFKRNNWKF